MTDRLSVLYAEDDPADADLTRAHFDAAAPDIDLEVVGTGAKCVARLAGAIDRYDAVLLDHQLPDINGLELIGELRRRQVNVPIVLVTAVGTEDLVVHALRGGAWDYVPKQGEYLQVLPDVIRSVVAEYRTRRDMGTIAQPRRRILYTEHDPADIDLTRRHFASVAPHLEMEVARTSSEALERLQRDGVDLLLIDLRMPDINALDVLRRLRRSPDAVPVIVVTGGGDENAAIAALKLGAMDYIVKRDNYLNQLPYAIENAIHRRQLVDINRRLQEDVKERERREEEKIRLLAEVEAQRRQVDELIDSIPGVLWEVEKIPGERTLQLTYVSPQIENLLGYSVEEWLNNPNVWPTVTPPEDLERVAREFEEALAQGRPVHTRYRWIARSGRVLWVEARGIVINDQSGRPSRMRGVTMDVTAAHEAEQRHQHLEAQLLQAQKLESIGRLAGGVAHDFNNLLTAINGYADLIRQEIGSNHPIAADLLEIRNAGERAAALTQQLLAFSRRQLLQPRVVDLNVLIDGATKLLTRVLGEDVEVVTRLEPALGRVKADAGQIEQVIMNLAVNARDAMPRGGTLVIETKNTLLDEAYSEGHLLIPPGPYVVIVVSDTGEGMDSQTLPQIFEPFFTTKESGKGTGLGLSTVYGIIKQSGGWIWAYSERGRGSSFKIYLPRVDAPLGAAEPLREDASRHRGTETVLVVEDDVTVRRLMTHVLGKAGYTVLESSSVDEAVRYSLMHTGQIQLLITDLVMPGMSGRELAHMLTKSQSNMRVLFVSGYTDDAVVRHGLVETGVHFLQKPFTPGVLGRKVREVLDSGGHPPHSRGPGPPTDTES